MCDANLRFTFTSVAGPGKMNDARVYRKLMGLHAWLYQLEDQYFCSGDNAYSLTNNMLIPFSVTSRNEEEHKTYNFYLSQLRIQVEMAFSRLTTKRRIIRSDLNCSTKKNCQIIRVGIKLYNYVINADNLNLIRFNSNNFNDLGVEPLVGGPPNNRGYYPTHNIITRGDDSSSRRNHIVDMIRERDIVRPSHNIVRNG